MIDDTEQQEMIESFRKQYPEYRDSQLQVAFRNEGQTLTISPTDNPEFGVSYYTLRPADEETDDETIW